MVHAPIADLIYLIKIFQDVLFYVLSDDVERSRTKLSNANPNGVYTIVFPGLGDNSAPGRKNPFDNYI